MRKVLFILLMLVGVLFSANNTGNLKFSKTLSPDETKINGSTVYFSGASDFYTGLISLKGITIGWASMNIYLDDEGGGSGQSFTVYMRYYDGDAGFSDYVEVGTAGVNTKVKIYLSALSEWEPAEKIQIRITAIGTGQVKHFISVIYN